MCEGILVKYILHFLIFSKRMDKGLVRIIRLDEILENAKTFRNTQLISNNFHTPFRNPECEIKLSIQFNSKIQFYLVIFFHFNQGCTKKKPISHPMIQLYKTCYTKL